MKSIRFSVGEKLSVVVDGKVHKYSVEDIQVKLVETDERGNTLDRVSFQLIDTPGGGEGVDWARGWNTTAAQALRTSAALRR